LRDERAACAECEKQRDDFKGGANPGEVGDRPTIEPSAEPRRKLKGESRKAIGSPGVDASDAFAAFIEHLGLPRKLSDVGVGEEKFSLIGENAMLSIFTRSNPQPIREPGDVVKILRLAA
jgi:alcohol dehydrogenase class IV